MATVLRLAPIFGDHMVLSREKYIRIFGEAESGKTVSVTLLGQTVSCIASRGRFMAVLPPMAHGGPYAMTVSDGTIELKFTDILIGDVYLAGGQSNMGMRLKDTRDGDRYTAESDYPAIRYCNYPVQAYLDEQTLVWERKTKWRVVQPGACGEISAVAFHFAVALQHDLDIPVGIIGCNLGGTSIVAWLDEEALCETTGGQAYLDAFLERIKDLSDEAYEKAQTRYMRSQADWSRKADAMKAEKPTTRWVDLVDALGPFPWPPPEGRKSTLRPCGLVNTMVKRIAPYTLTGFLFYQGESDSRHPYLYRGFLMSLIASWRDLFLSPSLPFLNVQLPMYIQGEEPVKNSWAFLRQAQEQVYADMKNVGLAVMIDGGEADDVHPKDKKTVGERLYQQAKQVVYHRDAENNPRAIAVQPSDHSVVVTVSSPLQTAADPKLFETAGADSVFYPATADIKGVSIHVTSDRVAHPVAVRYAWVNYGEVNVFGQNGLPLAPFLMR